MIGRRAARAIGWLIAGTVAMSGCTPHMMRAPTEGSRHHTIVLAGHALAYCADRGVEQWPASVTRVVIAVHGLDRNACGMLAAVDGALGLPVDEGDTAVIAPLFATRRDAAPGGHAWDPRGWPAGDPADTGVSSYAVMDALVEALGPRRITLVGFSGGGQFVNRYASVSPRTLHRYVVANPSSYLWFTPDRPVDPGPCPEANRWRYGLDGRQGYAAQSDAATLRARYGAREVHYLIGTADDDPRSASMDRSCAAVAQGPNREARALNYHRHLVEVFGTQIETRQPLDAVPGAGHNIVPMLASPEGREALRG